MGWQGGEFQGIEALTMPLEMDRNLRIYKRKREYSAESPVDCCRKVHVFCS
jgi:hypothetical protein